MERRRRGSKAIATEKGTFGIDDRLRKVHLYRVQRLLANASATKDILWKILTEKLRRDQRSEGKTKILMKEHSNTDFSLHHHLYWITKC